MLSNEPPRVLCAPRSRRAVRHDSITGPSRGSRTCPGGSPIPPIETEFLPGIPAPDPFAAIWGDWPGRFESARGGGHWQSRTALRTFAFTPRTAATARPRVNTRSTTGCPGRASMAGDCLEVVAEAWIGGVITASSRPKGRHRALFRCVDNARICARPTRRAYRLGDPRPTCIRCLAGARKT